MVKLAKAANKQATQKKKAPPPPKEVEEESSEEESSDEEETPPPKVVKKATPAKATPVVKNGAAAKKAESEEDDDDSEESEEEAPPPKKSGKPGAKTPVKAKPAKESSEEDESEEEAPPPKKATPAAKKAAKAAKEESDEDEDDEDEDEDESEEEMDTTPAPAKAKKAGMVKAKEESEEDDDEDDDEEDDEEEDDDEDDEDEAAATPAKRKAESKNDTPAAKKAKADGEGFCLFVGNLNSNKDFDELKDGLRKFFSKNGIELADVRLGGSKKFGYVEFSSEEDMQKALELNGKKLMGQDLKLDRARSKEGPQDGKRERDARTLFVKNLPFSATVDDLKEVFEDAVDVRLPPGQNGSNRGIAYIEFKSEADAEKTLEEAQGADVQGRSIMVDYVGDKSMGQKAPMSQGPGAASKTLVVNNLSFTATEEALQAAFEKAVSIRIPQRDGRPKGFAFLEFDSAEDAKDALENLNNTDIDGRSIRLEYSQNSGRDGGRGNMGPTKTLFVKGLSEDTSDQTLKDSFDGAAAARIVTDRETGSSKGFGFVDFNNEDDCKAAKEAMEDGEIDGRKVTLDYARPKGEGGFRGGRGGGFGGGGRGGRGGRGGFGGGGFGGGRGGGGFGGRGRGGPRGGGRGRGGFGGGRGGGGFGAKPQGKKIKFDD
ncbi:nucleolin isoform X3 [Gasterosteus aculeatus]